MAYRRSGKKTIKQEDSGFPTEYLSTEFTCPFCYGQIDGKVIENLEQLVQTRRFLWESADQKL